MCVGGGMHALTGVVHACVHTHDMEKNVHQNVEHSGQPCISVLVSLPTGRRVNKLMVRLVCRKSGMLNLVVRR